MANTEVKIQNEALDERWFERLQTILSTFPDIINALRNSDVNAEQQKKDFLSGNTRNPSLDYPHIDEASLSDAKEHLTGISA